MFVLTGIYTHMIESDLVVIHRSLVHKTCSSAEYMSSNSRTALLAQGDMEKLPNRLFAALIVNLGRTQCHIPKRMKNSTAADPPSHIVQIENDDVVAALTTHKKQS